MFACAAVRAAVRAWSARDIIVAMAACEPQMLDQRERRRASQSGGPCLWASHRDRDACLRLSGECLVGMADRAADS